MQDKDNSQRRVAIVGPSGITGKMRAALTLLATTHNLVVIDIEANRTNEQLKAYARAVRGAEKEFEQLKAWAQLARENWEVDNGAHLNFEENQKLKTKGCKSKQRRKW